MKKLVFLHGAGSDKNAYNDLVEQIAKRFDAKAISFNAPFPHPTKKSLKCSYVNLLCTSRVYEESVQYLTECFLLGSYYPYNNESR